MNQALFDHYIIQRTHHAARRPFSVSDLAAQYAAAGLSYRERMADRFVRATREETPYMAEDEKIVFVRTVTDLPDVLTPAEWEKMRERAHIHELGYVSNICLDYTVLVRDGLMAAYEGADPSQKREIEAILALTERYREEALRRGRHDVAEVLARVPRYGARSFREALQSFRILHYSLWLEGEYHNNVGRFDLLMQPYYEKDRAAGMSYEEAFDLLCDFFLSFNKDSDLYVGVQQGDNGQSMVLGGLVSPGVSAYSELSEMCLEASRELKLIDPKINLRVTKDTPLSAYEKATELTECGLGFPQYSNDDVIIPGLIDLGYAPEDAYRYVMAACWEPTIQGVGDDIPNIAALNLPKLTTRAIREAFAAGEDFAALKARLVGIMRSTLADINDGIRTVEFIPCPFLDLLRPECRYHNFGVHGSGMYCAVDSLAAVEKYVYEEKRVSPNTLLAAIDADFAGYEELAHLLRYEAPKLGQDEERTNALLGFFLEAMVTACAGLRNCYGGVWRPGTGTAMYYLRHPEEHGATADGRHAGEAYGANFSPSLFARIPGPLSLVRAATSSPLRATINGGPLTLEFSQSVFRREEGKRKVASLVRYYIQRGGHQLQLNTVNAEAMRAAQKHPEQYGRLVVRIWGWSAYFVELDEEFQNHVLARQEYRDI
ncbi:MAG: pyruvate formate-lyase [Clostridia bacterium]|nr:pyruvate formate-lyase [Clostridia bacterium]